MKMFLYLEIILGLFPFLACEKTKPEQSVANERMKLPEMHNFSDSKSGFNIQYPRNWSVHSVDKEVVFNCNEHEEANHQNNTHVSVTLDISRNNGWNLQEIVQNEKACMRKKQYEIDTNGERTDEIYALNGSTQAMIAYRITPANGDTVYGHTVLIPKDTLIYRLDFSGTGVQYGFHVPIFEHMLRSIRV